MHVISIFGALLTCQWQSLCSIWTVLLMELHEHKTKYVVEIEWERLVLIIFPFRKGMADSM
ncbi:hypothetical protein C8Q78DRAFT_997271 [Trametes maxima]|nr:hypothetical protein C8Q78DRAFT_997271 [Trametes maxima]